MSVLALDTSNYTTSAAAFDGREGENVGRPLQVRPGELGLRQSDALFQHVKQLPQLMEQLASQGQLENIQAVGASTRPRAVEGSYMPCFLAGTSQAQCLARTLGVPFLPSPTSRDIWRRQPGPPGGWICWRGRFWPGICRGAPPSCCGQSRSRME